LLLRVWMSSQAGERWDRNCDGDDEPVIFGWIGRTSLPEGKVKDVDP
jgi:hypothetical protein